MLVAELLVIGLTTVFFGSLVTYFLSFSQKDIENCFSKHFISFIIIFFFTGALIHFFYEIAGFNNWYCENKMKKV